MCVFTHIHAHTWICLCVSLCVFHLEVKYRTVHNELWTASQTHIVLIQEWTKQWLPEGVSEAEEVSAGYLIKKGELSRWGLGHILLLHEVAVGHAIWWLLKYLELYVYTHTEYCCRLKWMRYLDKGRLLDNWGELPTVTGHKIPRSLSSLLKQRMTFL